MGAKTYTIGDLARLTGRPVRRIRFYSDKGLLPPALRSASNYRFYADEDVAKLDLIHALREAGVGLDTIKRLLARRLSLSDVLQPASTSSKRRSQPSAEWPSSFAPRFASQTLPMVI